MGRALFYIIGIALLLAGCTAADSSQSHYQRGHALAQQSQSAEAMREYLLAVEADDDATYVAKALSQLGHLSMNHSDQQQALGYFEQAWQRAAQLGDVQLMVLAQRDLGRLWRMRQQPERALQYFARADSLLTAARADSLVQYVYPEYISLLMDAGRAGAARQLVRSLPVGRTSGPLCLVAGKFYAEQGQQDSATYYFRRCLETDNVSSRASAAMYLSELTADDDNWEQAYGYALECAALVDSAKLVMQQENASLVSSLTDQLAVERENSRLYRVLAAVIIGVILASAVLTIFVRERIARLKRQHEEERRASVSRARNRQEKLIEEFHNTQLYRQILMNESINTEQWQDLQQYLDSQTDGFTSKLTTFYPAIKPQELQVCQLLKLEFTNQQIAAIQCKTQQAITNLRKRLYQKIFGKEGSADDLNQFVRLFPQV